MSESLKAKTVKGVGWSFADNLANSGITFLVGLVLARLLTPSEYGMLATIMIFIAVANSIVDSGFSNALIRKIDARSVITIRSFTSIWLSVSCSMAYFI